jgi:uncharacterized OsmC-like protein
LNDYGLMVIRRIHVTYHLKVDPDKHEAAERAHDNHAKYCEIAQTIWSCVDITTSLEMETV